MSFCSCSSRKLLANLFICTLLINDVILSTIDNELTGDPVVDCEDTMVSLTFKTKKPFTGRVYVQGLADDDRCARNFAANSDQSKFSMMIQNGDCTMQRQRVSGMSQHFGNRSLSTNINLRCETPFLKGIEIMCKFRNPGGCDAFAHHCCKLPWNLCN